MNIPLTFSVAYLFLGMLLTAQLWSSMAMEIEMAIGMEEEDVQGPLRFFLTIIFVLAWPVVLWDVVTKE